MCSPLLIVRQTIANIAALHAKIFSVHGYVVVRQWIASLFSFFSLSCFRFPLFGLAAVWGVSSADVHSIEIRVQHTLSRMWKIHYCLFIATKRVYTAIYFVYWLCTSFTSTFVRAHTIVAIHTHTHALTNVLMRKFEENTIMFSCILCTHYKVYARMYREQQCSLLWRFPTLFTFA